MSLRCWALTLALGIGRSFGVVSPNGLVDYETKSTTVSTDLFFDGYIVASKTVTINANCHRSINILRVC